MKNKIFVIIAALILMFTMSVPVFAEDGNLYGSDEVTKVKTQKDFYWAGQSLNIAEPSIGYDALVAGRQISMTDGKIGGAARMAGETIVLNNMKIDRNVTMVARTINLSNCKFDTGALLGQEVSINGGKAKDLRVTADLTTVSGKIDGDLHVNGESLRIEPGAEITGNIVGELSTKPVISSEAKVGNVDIKVKPEDKTKSEEPKKKGFAFPIWWFLASMLMWLAFRLFFRKPVDEASVMVKEKPGIMAGIGAIALFGAPIGMLLLMLTVIGIPISIITVMIYISLIMVSTAFAGSAAGMAIFKKMNPWASTAIGAAVLLILGAIPYVKFIVHTAAAMFTMGYFLYALYVNHMKRKQDTGNEGI